MTPDEELRRLRLRSTSAGLPGGHDLLRYVVQAPDPADVIGRATDVAEPEPGVPAS